MVQTHSFFFANTSSLWAGLAGRLAKFWGWQGGSNFRDVAKPLFFLK
jgi:hypothetical protein